MYEPPYAPRNCSASPRIIPRLVIASTIARRKYQLLSDRDRQYSVLNRPRDPIQNAASAEAEHQCCPHCEQNIR